MSSLLRFVWIFASVCPALDALRCYYCASMSTKIAPHLWLHSAPCAQRRLASCPTARQSCVVVRVQHDRINFTVAGCAEDDFVGCERFVQLAAHGPTAVHLCQCAADRCNSDFHLDFGAGLGHFHSNSSALMSRMKDEGQLPVLKKVHPLPKGKSERAMPCSDLSCNEQPTSQATVPQHSSPLLSVFLFLYLLRTN